jgi:CBS domain containing-hemolysin-like protein
MEYAHSEDELRLLISSAHRGAIADSFGRNIVLNAFDLPHRMVREVMRPRLEIVGLDTDATIAECIEVAEKTRYSRFPLLENGNIDRALGVVHIKDLYALRKTASTGRDLLPVARKVIYVPPTAKLEKLLNLLLEHRLHMALVVDEYGGTMGMVTLENILEELVGQIQDEFDQEKPMMRLVKDRVWEVDGRLPLHELAELAGEPLQAPGISTASGWVTHRLGGFPKQGDVIQLSRCELRVLSVLGHRADTLLITQFPTQELGGTSMEKK